MNRPTVKLDIYQFSQHMLEAMTEFFSHCPGCGRRFHIKLESKKLLDEHREESESQGVEAGRFAGRLDPRYTLEDSGPMVFDIKNFQYTYKCGHCGHEWSEKRKEEQRIN